MKILIDIGHPAQVHIFRYFISEMEKKGHEIVVCTRDKDISIDLLKAFKIPYINLGKYRGTLGKVVSLLTFNMKLVRLSKEVKPDLFLSAGSVHAAQTSALLRKYSITFMDTEKSIIPYFGHLLYTLFTDAIFTPSSYERDLGPKQQRYKGYHELAYLHPAYFKPKSEILDKIGISKKDKIILIRHVAWEAHHDFQESGLSHKDEQFYKTLEDYGTVILSSEKKVPRKLRKYVLSIPPEEMHNVMYYSSLYLGEGATMTTESVLLGTPAIYVNSIRCGTINELSKYGLVDQFHDYNANKILDTACTILENPNSKSESQRKSKKLISQKIDVTKFMIGLVEKYEQSQKKNM